jgi:hypothetical protein
MSFTASRSGAPNVFIDEGWCGMEFTVDQLISKLKDLSFQGYGDLPVCVPENEEWWTCNLNVEVCGPRQSPHNPLPQRVEIGSAL